MSEVYGLFFEDIEVALNIGVHDFEKAGKQRLLVDVSLAVTASAAADDIEAVLDYDRVMSFIAGLSDAGHVELQETLCRQVLAHCKGLDGVVGVIVRTRKPDVYANARAVGCRMAWLDEGRDRLEVSLALGARV